MVAALLDHPRNARAFENAGGLQTVTSLFRARNTPQPIKLKIVEFFYFYLMPELPQDTGIGTKTPAHQRNASKASILSVQTIDSVSSTGETLTRTTENKQNMLGQYLTNVQDLVLDMREHAALGQSVI